MVSAPIARMTLRRRPRDQLRLAQISNLARSHGVPTVATNDVLFHIAGQAYPAGRCDLHSRTHHHR